MYTHTHSLRKRLLTTVSLFLKKYACTQHTLTHCHHQLRLSDTIADCGPFVVVVPDVFRGSAPSPKPWPPVGFDFHAWLAGHTWDGHVKGDIEATVKYIRDTYPAAEKVCVLHCIDGTYTVVTLSQSPISIVNSCTVTGSEAPYTYSR